jgi:hypothetical protein
MGQENGINPRFVSEVYGKTGVWKFIIFSLAFSHGASGCSSSGQDALRINDGGLA